MCSNCNWCDKSQDNQGIFKCIKNNHDIFLTDYCEKYTNKKGEGKQMADNVNHPFHYNDGKIEVIDYIEDKNLGFHLGNVVKYVSRAGKKDKSKAVEDLKKARWYLEREITRMEEQN